MTDSKDNQGSARSYTDSENAFSPQKAWDELVHKDDRTSPEEYPDHCLISFEELQDFMIRGYRAPAQAAPGRNRDPVFAPDGKTWYQTALDEASRRGENELRIHELEAALAGAPHAAGYTAQEPCAWRYKCHDGQFVYMEVRLTDEQKARGYYPDELDDEDDGESGPFQWTDETPVYAHPSTVRGEGK